MAKINKHIEIAVTSDKRLSSMSIRSRNMIKDVLERYYKTVNISIVNDSSDLEKLISKNPDLVFSGVKRLPISKYKSEGKGKDKDYVWVSVFLEERGIAVTGSGAVAYNLEQDKTKAKDVVNAAGLTTSPYFTAKKGQYTEESQLPLDFPMFLKPYNRGGGVGIDDDSVVRNFNEFEAKISSLVAKGIPKVLVENFLSGREFTVAVLRDEDGDELKAMPVEKIPEMNERGDRLMGHAMKSTTDEIPIGVIKEGKLKEAVSNLARRSFKAIGARDYGRIDIRLDENGAPSFLEANLLPSMIDGSGNFPKAFCQNTGRSYDDMLLHIANLAFSH